MQTLWITLSIILTFVHGLLHSSLSKSDSSIMALSAARIPIDKVLQAPQWPAQWPYRPADFRRQDESGDGFFYGQPRFVYHIDDEAVRALTSYYSKVFFDGAAVLDLCSSWVSHYPSSFHPSRVSGLGMNREELARNSQLNEFVVQDLNINPKLPYPENTFDFVTLVVSVDYLIKPLEVFKEIQRVLKPGGLAIISQSNRCFPTKAINIWLRTNDAEHVFIIGSYFHYAGGFEKAESLDLSPFPDMTDPLYIVQARKSKQ